MSQRAFFGALFVLALLMTLKYFPGLENPAAYAGNVYQAIHPDAFPNDPYIGPERSVWQKPFQLSLFYVLVKFSGEIWLDDRFTAAVYFLLILVSMVGIDRICRVAGMRDALPRLAVQLVFMRDHQSLSHNVTFAHQQDLNHAAFAIPIIIWLIYAAVARKSLWLILSLSVLLAGMSIKNAPWVIACCLIVAAVNGGKLDRAVVGGVFSAALVAFYGSVVYLFPVPAEDKIAVWDMIYRYSEIGFDANPFYFKDASGLSGMLVRNAVFLGVCLSAMFMPGPDNAALRSLRVFVGLGLGIWLLGGLYMSFAPDAWKIPHLLPFSLVRSLGWPQTMAYLVIMVSLFHWLKEWDTPYHAILTFVGIGILLVIGPENHGLWAVLFVLSAVVFCVIEIGVTQRRYSLVLTQALAITIGIAFAATISTRMPYWKTWAETGVFGYAPSAEWIGVAEYFHENTPKDASVLPFQRNPHLRVPHGVSYQYGLLDNTLPEDGLIASRHIATRSGRTTPIINELSDIFSLEGWRRELYQQQVLKRIARAFQNGWLNVAARELRKLVLVPHYIVLPSAVWDSERTGVLPYAEETRIRDYVVLTRRKEE